MNTALLAPTALRWDERNNLIGAGPVARPDGASEQVWMSYDFTNTLAQRVMEHSAAPDAVLRQTQLTLGSYVLRQTTDLATGVTERLVAAHHERRRRAGRRQRRRRARRRYQLDDKLGSVSVELDEDAALVSYEAFYPMAAPPSSPDRTRPRSPPRRCAIQASRATTAPASTTTARATT